MRVLVVVLGSLLGALRVDAAPATQQRGSQERPETVATFSIVAADPETGEVGVAVASRFFAVGSVVPYARAGVGAVATQANVNGDYGPKGLELLASGMAPEAVVKQLTGKDPDPSRRQLGIVSASGASATFTGKETTTWAGGRAGKNYAVQGNILTGPDVVEAMERAFLETKGDLAERMIAALVAGDAKGGDSRGKQSAALLIARPGAGYGGYNDRFIDVRVDDHPQPLKEIARLMRIGRVNAYWNLAWTEFTRKRYAEALPIMERTASMAEKDARPILPEVLYDLTVIRSAAGKNAEALQSLKRAVRANPKLAKQAREDADLAALRKDPGFEKALR